MLQRTGACIRLHNKLTKSINQGKCFFSFCFNVDLCNNFIFVSKVFQHTNILTYFCNALTCGKKKGIKDKKL